MSHSGHMTDPPPAAPSAEPATSTAGSAAGSATSSTVGSPVLEVGAAPATRRAWWAELLAHREVLMVLARKDFQTRYKRATLGIVWAVAVPLLQGAVMAVVFSRVVSFTTGADFGAYVIGGIMAWSYFAATLSTATSAIVDASSLTDKVWFPRILLVLVPAMANTVGLVISFTVLVALLPVLDAGMGLRLALLAPAMALLIAFTMALSLVLSALYVYFRDVKFLVQAALLVWLYVTPIVYYQDQFDGAGWLDLNPMTGVVELFRIATVGGDGDWARAVGVTVVTTMLLAVAGVEAHRRHDRLFVDQL